MTLKTWPAKRADVNGLFKARFSCEGCLGLKSQEACKYYSDKARRQGLKSCLEGCVYVEQKKGKNRKG